MEDLAYTPNELLEIYKIKKVTASVKRKYGLNKKDSNYALYKILNDKLLLGWESDSDSSSDYIESDDDY
jgi:hypothetical protein